MNSGATPPRSPSAGWYPDPLDPGSERLWDGERWTEQIRPASALAPAPVSLPPPPSTDRSPAERHRERSASGWSTGSLVGLGVGLLALLTVGGCALLLGVVPLVAVRSQGTFVAEEVEVAVAIPETTVFAEPEFDAGGPVVAYGTGAEVIGVFGNGDAAAFEIMVDEPVSLDEPMPAEGGVPGVDDELIVGIPFTIVLLDAAVDPFPAAGTLDWTIVGGATAATYRPADPGNPTIGCDAADDTLSFVEELSLGEIRSGIVCLMVPPRDFEHPETRVVLTVGDGAPAIWTR